MKTVYRQTWIEVPLSDIKDGDVFKFAIDSEAVTADGDAYERDGGEVVKILEDCVEED
jgi:hypothetical protein